MRRIDYTTPSELRAAIKAAVGHLRGECNPITVGDVMAVLGYDLPSLSPFDALVFVEMAGQELAAVGFAPSSSPAPISDRRTL